MLEVGFQLYNDMLAEAVRALKSGREPDLLARADSSAPRPRSTSTPGAAARRLLRRRARAAEPVQAAGDGRTRRAARCAARGDHRTASEAPPPKARRCSTPIGFGSSPKPYGIARIDANPNLVNITFRPNPPIDAVQDHRAGAGQPQRSSSPATTGCGIGPRDRAESRSGRSWCASFVCRGPRQPGPSRPQPRPGAGHGARSRHPGDPASGRRRRKLPRAAAHDQTGAMRLIGQRRIASDRLRAARRPAPPRGRRRATICGAVATRMRVPSRACASACVDGVVRPRSRR